MWGDFILWIRYKKNHRVKYSRRFENLNWRWFIFKEQNFECIHDYRMIKPDLSLGSLYACKKCGRRKTTKKNYL